MEEQNKRCLDDQCPIDLLEKLNGERLNHCLSRFIVKELYGALKVKYWELRVASLGAKVKYGPIVTKDEEDMLWWKSGVLCDHDSVAL